jgi:carbon storage regulator
MLILSRKPGDAIVIGDGIRIVVIECDRRGVRLGIEAPPHVSILREEIVNAIASENRRANTTAEAAGWLDILPVRGRQAPTAPAPAAEPPAESEG